MVIFQKIGFQQGLKIALLRFLSQGSKGVIRRNMNERLRLIIEPAVKDLDTIHQALRSRSEISLPVLELKVIDCGKQGLFIKAVLYDVLQDLADGLHELLFLRSIHALGNKAKVRLSDAILVDTVDILADFGVDQSLLHGCPRHTAKCKIQNLQSDISLSVQGIAEGPDPCQIRIILEAVALADRHCLYTAHRSLEGRLHTHLGIHLKIIEP